MAASRDSQAVLDLFELYYDRVYCFARRSLDQSAAEDIAQEVFIKLLGLEGIADREITCSYLVKVADNLIKRRYRRMRRFDAYLDARAQEAGHSFAERETRRPSAEFSSEDFDALSPREQDAIRLIVCQGLSYQEAADALGVRVSSLNNWKHRGIQRLRERHDAKYAAPQRPGDAAVRGGDLLRKAAG